MSENCITNETVKEIFQNVGGKPKLVHKALCELGGVQPDTVIVGSVYNKSKRIVHEIKRLRSCKNELRLCGYLQETFTFPKQILKSKPAKPAQTIEDLNEHIKILKTNVQNHSRLNLKLREKIKQINVSRLNQKIKRQTSTITRQQIIIQELRRKIKHLEKGKTRYDCNEENRTQCKTTEKGKTQDKEKSTQCNTTKKVIDDLGKEIEITYLFSDIMDGKVKIFYGIVICMILIEFSVYCQHTQYQFKRYTYKKKRDDKKFRSAKTPCEGRPDCLAHQGVDQVMCVRECMSKFCYEELYKHDPLEEGEIDIRLNSFKGCLSQQSNNIYSQVNNVDLDGNYVLN